MNKFKINPDVLVSMFDLSLVQASSICTSLTSGQNRVFPVIVKNRTDQFWYELKTKDTKTFSMYRKDC